jgi:hypothetical protein
MRKRKQVVKSQSGKHTDVPQTTAGDDELATFAAQDQVTTSNLSLHDLFQQQAREMLDRSDLDEEQKASILVAMSCPCCGAGGMSFTARLKRRS